MGLVRSFVLNFIVGPMLVYFLLLGHVAYQIFKTSSKSEPAPAWPLTVDAKEKEAIIASRKAIIEDLNGFLAGRNVKFFQTHAIEDVQLEDPIQKLVGMEECNNLSLMWSLSVESADVKTGKVVHAPHEIIVDQTLTVSLQHFNNYSVLTLIHISGKAEEPSISTNHI